jgi:RNA polymerase primary sigma factor
MQDTTDFGRPSLKLMMREIANTTPITRVEEYNLFREYRTAGINRKRVIQSKIISCNMRFVLKACLPYKNYPRVDLAEIVGEGKIGLLIAFDKFDYQTNNKFISYAVWHIRSRVSKYMEENDLIRLPSHQKVKLNSARKLKNSLNDDGTEYEYDDEIAYLDTISQTHTSLERRIYDDSDVTLGDTLTDDTVEASDKLWTAHKLKSSLRDVLPTILTKDEYIVIKSLFGMDSGTCSGLRETANIIGKSHERVRQIRDRALGKLRKSISVHDLFELLREHGQE